MKNNKGLIIFIAVLVILFIPIITEYIGKQTIEIISSKKLSEKINSKESFILYVGDMSKSTIKELINIRDNKDSNTLFDYGVYGIKENNIDKEMKNKKIIVYIEGDIQKSYDNYNKKSVLNDINKYYNGVIADEDKSYKVAENYNAYKKIVNSDVVTMAVFGRNSCGWCNKFKPVYNAVAEKYNVDIYYFDSDNYNSSDYTKIVNMNLVVPAKCSSAGKEFKLSEGFGTPLTIFTKNGSIVDCIGGYKDRASLIDILKKNEIIRE